MPTPKVTIIGPRQLPPITEFLTPTQLDNLNDPATLMAYVGLVCQSYDGTAFNYKGQSQYPQLMGLSSAVFTSAMTQYATRLNSAISFADIDRNVNLYKRYGQQIVTNFPAYQATLQQYTQAGGTNGDGGCVFPPPFAVSVAITPPQGVSQQVYNMLRVLYTAGKFIGYFYQHHYLPTWEVPKSVLIPPTSGTTGGTPTTTWAVTAYTPAKTIGKSLSRRRLIKSLNLSGYPVSLSASGISNSNWNIGANLYSQPTKERLTGLRYTSRGLDCTNFTKLVNFLALGVFFASDTQEQAYGIISNSDSWANTSPLFSTHNYPTTTDGYGMSPFSGQILVNGNTPSQPWTDLSNSQVLSGDVAILSPAVNSVLSPPTHGIIYLSYPYVMDSDNFIGSYPGIFVRNITTAQAYYPNTIMNSNNVFILRRFTNFNGSNASLAPSETYLVPMSDIKQDDVVNGFSGTPISIS